MQDESCLSRDKASTGKGISPVLPLSHLVVTTYVSQERAPRSARLQSIHRARQVIALRQDAAQPRRRRGRVEPAREMFRVKLRSLSRCSDKKIKVATLGKVWRRKRQRDRKYGAVKDERGKGETSPLKMFLPSANLYVSADEPLTSHPPVSSRDSLPWFTTRFKESQSRTRGWQRGGKSDDLVGARGLARKAKKGRGVSWGCSSGKAVKWRWRKRVNAKRWDSLRDFFTSRIVRLARGAKELEKERISGLVKLLKKKQRGRRWGGGRMFGEGVITSVRGRPTHRAFSYAYVQDRVRPCYESVFFTEGSSALKTLQTRIPVFASGMSNFVHTNAPLHVSGLGGKTSKRRLAESRYPRHLSQGEGRCVSSEDTSGSSDTVTRGQRRF
jgi:hypothetical protein